MWFLSHGIDALVCCFFEACCFLLRRLTLIFLSILQWVGAFFPESGVGDKKGLFNLTPPLQRCVSVCVVLCVRVGRIPTPSRGRCATTALACVAWMERCPLSPGHDAQVAVELQPRTFAKVYVRPIPCLLSYFSFVRSWCCFTRLMC